jgi:glucokinase
MTSHVAGIDLGGTKMLTRVLDPDDPTRVVVETRVDTPTGAAEVVAALAAAVDDVDRRLGELGRGAVQAVGVGAAGLVDRSGVMRHAPNLVGMDEFALGEALVSATGRLVVIDNDATAATMAEWQLGAARGVDDMVLVALGTGIGAGVVSGGVLQRGAGGFAGEAGHMIVDPSGPPCPCGRRGCWERYASGNGLGRLARDAAAAGKATHVVAEAGGDPDLVRGEHVARAAAAGDPEALAIVDDFAWWVALGASNLVAVLDSAMVVVAGGLVAMGDLLMVPVRRHFTDLLVSVDHRPVVPVAPAALGPEAGATGAWLAAAQLLVDAR